MVHFQHAFQPSRGCDEVAREAGKHIRGASFDSSRLLCFRAHERKRRHLLSPVSAECGLIKEKIILYYGLFP